MLKRGISIILILSMLISFSVTIFAAEGDNPTGSDDYIVIPLVEDKGVVGHNVILVNNYNTEFLLISEDLNEAGEAVSPRIETSITKDEFETYCENSSYLRLIVNTVANNGDSILYNHVVFDRDGNILDSSYAGDLVAGSVYPIAFDTSEDVYSWILDDNGQYYAITVNKKADTSTYVSLTEAQYNERLLNKTYSYSKVIRNDDETDTITTAYYGGNGEVIGSPMIIKKDSSVNIPELSYVLHKISGGSIPGLEAIEKTVIPYLDKINAETEKRNAELEEAKKNSEEREAAIKRQEEEEAKQRAEEARRAAEEEARRREEEGQTGGRTNPPEESAPPAQTPPAQLETPPEETAPEEEETDPYELPTILKDKYAQLYSNWTDEFNRGYLGIWGDPYYNGQLTLIEWTDPFWRNDEINHSTYSEVESGYYDSVGNFIKTDSSGNPLPSESGTFDSAGNFKPANSNGYYDPNGIYHPLFNTIAGVSYDAYGNFHIENKGYFDNSGIWHAKDIDKTQIVLFDGRIVYTNGYMENPSTGVKIKIDKDIWGKYYFGDEVIYSDSSVYNKETRSLYLSTGEVYEGQMFDNYILFENNDAILLNGLEKGKKTISGILLANGARITESGVIQYPNSIAYSEQVGISFPNGTIVKQSFGGKIYNNNEEILKEVEEIQQGIETTDENLENINEVFFDVVEDGEYDKYFELKDYGRLYSNGHIAVYNEYGDLVTDNDCIIYKDRVLMYDGLLIVGDNIYQTYYDANKNIVSPDGYVIDSQMRLGTYNVDGTFLNGGTIQENGYFDRLGNFISFNGVVSNEKLEAGFYNKYGVLYEGDISTDYYYTADAVKINPDGTVETPAKLYGYYDKHDNFIMNDGNGMFNKNGIFSQMSNDTYYNVTPSGLFYENIASRFILNQNGTVSVMGEKGTYDENGLVTINKLTGYYDENGIFIVSKRNPYISLGYFYDSSQNKHNSGTIYKDNNGSLRLLQNPKFGLEVIGNKLKITNGKAIYDETGLATVGDKVGYFTSEGEFIASNKSPYIGGFYDENGFWIDQSYYTDRFGDLVVNYGGFNSMGNYITPSGDIGCFDINGSFMLNETNKYVYEFYDNNGHLQDINGLYIDEFGLYKNWNGEEAYNGNGVRIDISNAIGIKMNDYTMIERGMFISPEGKIGHFDSNGDFVSGKPMYTSGFFGPSGGFISYGTTKNSTVSANFIYILNKYYVVFEEDGNVILKSYDGYSYPVEVANSKYYVLSDGTAISDTGELCYIENYYREINTAEEPSENNENEENEESPETMPKEEKVYSITRGSRDYQRRDITTLSGYIIDTGDEYGYFLKDGTFVLYDGQYGYYNSDGTLISDSMNPYSNGFYKGDGKWVGTSDLPNVGYFNNYGIRRNGENPYNLGYYDYEGTYHLFDRSYFITYSGNVVEIGDNALGYFDNNRRFFVFNKDGYFDADGNYYIDNILQGYYDKDAVLNKGKNPNFDGFYDMFGYWHMFGDNGYYDENGYYYEDVTDSKSGYFNEVGEFTDGYNPYVNGYNDINGNWSNTSTLPLTSYYESDGTVRMGLNPYTEGYYDMYSNWHRYGDKGYFDKHGTYYSISDGSIGYYDNRGNYAEGTNPYLHGYYDEDGNLRLFGKVGYYTREGTYVDEKGEWHFINTGSKKRGANPNTDGFYDDEGNYYPFDENGYYTPEGVYFPIILVVDRYMVGSPNYILFEGIFDNPDYVPASSKMTVQFTFNPQDAAPTYVDTGIKVSRNAMISYANARDVLHNIAIYSHNTFIEDNDSCMVIINGRIINLINDGKMSIKELRDKFKDFNISIVSARTRVNRKFALADAVELERDIRILYRGEEYRFTNPLIVRNGIPYIPLKDITDISIYSARVDNNDGVRNISFTIKESEEQIKQDVFIKAWSVDIGDTQCLMNTSGSMFTYYILKAPIISETLYNGSEEVYIPVYLLDPLTGSVAEYNTTEYLLELKEIGLLYSTESNGVIVDLTNLETPYEDD